MRRRTFVLAALAAACGRPAGARAQGSGKLKRVGWIE